MAKVDSVHTRQLIIFTILFTGYAFYALNRKAVSLVLPELISSGLDKSDAGLIISCQNVAYAISKFIGGILSDRLSSRILFGCGLFFSGLATILFGISTDSLLIYSTLWFANGFAQGFGWPSCAKLLRHWFSPDQFGTFWSLLSSSVNISGSLSPFLAAFITLNFGWRTTLIAFGGVSIAMSLVGFFGLVNCPQDIGYPIINPNAAPKPKSNASVRSDQSWKDLLASPFIWMLSFSYMMVFAAKSAVCDWGQMYLIEEKQRSQLVGSSFTSSVEMGGFFGGILAGYLTDWILRNSPKNSSKPTANMRLPVAIVMMVCVSLSLHAFCFHITESTSNIFITLLGAITGCSLYGPIAIFGVMASESAPAHLSGTSHAIVALAANVGAIIAGLPFSVLAEQYSWMAVFLMLELTITGTVCLMFFARNVPPISYAQEKRTLSKKKKKHN